MPAPDLVEVLLDALEHAQDLVGHEQWAPWEDYRSVSPAEYEAELDKAVEWARAVGLAGNADRLSNLGVA